MVAAASSGMPNRVSGAGQPSADAHYNESGRYVERVNVVRKSIWERRIEDDGGPIVRLETAVDHFVALWRLHP
jgi:hypothetical protein